jgi:AbrB family looped-hinge helix DNA binding protein
MRITSKGQVTIPIEIRRRGGFLPDTEVEFQLEGDAITIRRVRRERALAHSRAVLESMRGKGDVNMTTDEIMALMRGDD